MQPPDANTGADLMVKWIRRFAKLIRHVGDGSRRPPNSGWTVAETAAHLRVITGEYQGLLDGADHPWGCSFEHGARVNAELIAKVPERDLQTLARHIERDGLALAERLRTHTAPVHFVVTHLPAGSVATMVAGECMVHGWDVARAFDLPWPIPPDEAILLAAATEPLLPSLMDPARRDFRAVIGLKLRGGPALTLAFADGALTVSDGSPARADCRILADPTAYMLSAYGRLGPVGPALRGQMVAYGRKPWLALQIAKVMRTP